MKFSSIFIFIVGFDPKPTLQTREFSHFDVFLVACSSEKRPKFNLQRQEIPISRSLCFRFLWFYTLQLWQNSIKPSCCGLGRIWDGIGAVDGRRRASICSNAIGAAHGFDVFVFFFSSGCSWAYKDFRWVAQGYNHFCLSSWCRWYQSYASFLHNRVPV